MFEEPSACVGFYDPYTEGQNYSPYRKIREANGLQEIVKEIHALKLLNMTKPAIAISTAWALENIFKSLPNSEQFIEALTQQAEKNDGTLYNPELNGHVRFRGGVDKTAPEFNFLVRRWRERIGKLALDVFFETVFDRNKKVFWEYISNPNKRTWQPEPLSPKIYPTSLCVFLNYFTSCNEETKRAHKGNIRKFLKNVFDEPIEVDGAKVGISDWTAVAREVLATALVANGMYEECIDYGISEAQQILALKFIGKAFIEQEDGLVSTFTSGNPMSVEEAMQKACNDREWRHIWSVLSIMSYKYGNAHLIRTIDTADPRTSRGTNAPLKLALMFDASLEEGREGF